MGGVFDLFGKMKGTACQRYGHRYVIARCEWTFKQEAVLRKSIKTHFTVARWKKYTKSSQFL